MFEIYRNDPINFSSYKHGTSMNNIFELWDPAQQFFGILLNLLKTQWLKSPVTRIHWMHGNSSKLINLIGIFSLFFQFVKNWKALTRPKEIVNYFRSHMSICTDHDQIYRLHFKVYGATGHWRTLSSSKWKQFIWDLYFGTVHLAIIIQTIALLIDAYIIRQNLEKLSTNLCSSITFVGTVYKIWVFIVNQKTIEKLSHKLQNNLFISRVGQSKSDKDILQKYSKLVAKVLRALGLMASFLIVFWSVFPILDSGSEKRYPFPFPVYNAPTPIYEIVYVYQVLILISVSFNVLTYDMIFYGFMARICAQYEILAKNISQIKDLSCDKGKVRSVNEDEVKKIKDKKVIKIIKENVIHHKEILR